MKNDLYKIDIIESRGFGCEICGRNTQLELHHCLYGRDKHRPELDCEYNYQVVCKQCHMTVAESAENKWNFLLKQIDRYGYDIMYKWHESIPKMYRDNRDTRLLFERYEKECM